MKVRKLPIALMLLLTLLGTVWEHKARVIAAVTNEENCLTNQSTNIITGESKESYILLNKLRDEVKKEYLNAYFTYNENGLYVDGTDAVPLELLENRKGYLSIGFDYNCLEQITLEQAKEQQADLWKVIDLGTIWMTLAQEPIYWKVVNEKGVYETAGKELLDTNMRDMLPQTMKGLKGYLIVQDRKDVAISGKIDLVPIEENSVENITCINDSIHADNLSYNEKLYKYIMDGSQSKLIITANYQFEINLPNHSVIEGSITFTKNYFIHK